MCYLDLGRQGHFASSFVNAHTELEVFEPAVGGRLIEPANSVESLTPYRSARSEESGYRSSRALVNEVVKEVLVRGNKVIPGNRLFVAADNPIDVGVRLEKGDN